jgi:hypothetical protein
LVNEIALGLAREQIAVQEEENARELVPDRRQSWHRPLEGMQRERGEAGRLECACAQAAP